MNRKSTLVALPFVVVASLAFGGAYAQVGSGTDNDNDLYAATAEFPAQGDSTASKSAVDELRDQIYRDMQHE